MNNENWIPCPDRVPFQEIKIHVIFVVRFADK